MKEKRNISNREYDLERPQLTSNDLKKPQLTSKENSPNIETVKPKKNKLKGDENFGSNGENSDEILHINNL